MFQTSNPNNATAVNPEPATQSTPEPGTQHADHPHPHHSKRHGKKQHEHAIISPVPTGTPHLSPGAVTIYR
jgi:hypothetical protein